MIKIRRASIKDVEAVRKLNQDLFEHNYQFNNTLNLKWPSKNKKYFVDRIKGKKSLCLVAENEDKIIGYLIGSIEKAEDWRKIKNIAEAENMLIIEEFRGRGIGTNLLKEFLKWAKSKGAERAFVVASASNEKAIRTYSKIGFVPYNNVMEMDL